MKIRSSNAPTWLAGLTAVLVTIGCGYEALAQQPKAKAAPKGAPAAKGQPEQAGPKAMAAVEKPWVKVCETDPQSKQEGCIVQKQLFMESGQFLGSMGISQVKGESAKLSLVITAPAGMLLEPGLRIAIDPKKPPTALRYTFCRPDAPVCLSYSEISADFVNELKKNKSAVVQMLNLSKRTINLEFMLTDFTKSYDGPAIDPKVVEQQQKKLQDELQKRAEEARKKLLEGQAKK